MNGGRHDLFGSLPGSMNNEWMDDIDTLCGYRSLTHSDLPDVIASSSQQEDVKHIRAILMQLADDSIEPRQVCIAARTNDGVEAIVDG